MVIAGIGFICKAIVSKGGTDWEFLFETGKVAMILAFSPFYLTKSIPPEVKKKPIIKVNFQLP